MAENSDIKKSNVIKFVIAVVLHAIRKILVKNYGLSYGKQKHK